MPHFKIHNLKVLSEFEIQVPEASLELHQWMLINAPSGFGKTTLLRGLAGLEKTEGEIWLDGKRIDSLSPAQRNIGMVFQDHLLFPHLSAVENVAYGLVVRGMNKKSALEQAKTLLNELSLEDKYDAPITVLSGGERQRLSLLRAVAWKPKLLILDEPFKGLDDQNQNKMMQYLQQFSAQNNTSVILVSHDGKSIEGGEKAAERLMGTAGENTNVRAFHRS